MGKCQSIQKSKNKTNYFFYYSCEIDDWAQAKKSDWKEFDHIGQKELIYSYNIYLKDPKEKSQFDIPSQPKFIFDFKNWNRINKETEGILPIKKEYLDIDSNIKRAKNEKIYLPIEKIPKGQPLTLPDKILEKDHKIFSNDKVLDSMQNTYNFQINKNRKKIQFNVITGFNIELKIKNELCFFDDNYILDLNFNLFLISLKDELTTFAKIYNDGKDIEKYIKILDTVSNSYLFFNKIIEIFNYEGFLKNKVNEILHNNVSNYFEDIKLFYVTLLASLKYVSLNQSKSNFLNESFIYMVTKPTKQDFDFYEANDNKDITRIFNEFLLCTKSENYAKKLLDFNNINEPQFFWKIIIPKYLMEREGESLCFAEGILPIPNNEEVFLKSGSILYIDSITPYKETDIIKREEKKDYTNKYFVNAILRTFSFESYFQVMKIKNNLIAIGN